MPESETVLRAGAAGRVPALAVFQVFLKLGLTSFGGPVAHLGYFRNELVARRRWVDDAAYADMSRSASSCPARPAVRSGSPSVCSAPAYAGRSRPGSPSRFHRPSCSPPSPTAWRISTTRTPGGCAGCWSSPLPSSRRPCGAWRGLFARTAPRHDRHPRRVIVLLWPTSAGQVAVIAAARSIGCAFLGEQPRCPPRSPCRWAPLCLALFGGLLWVCPRLAHLPAPVPGALRQLLPVRLAGVRRRSRSPAAPPAAVVPPGWVSNDAFLAGYGAAQAVPGPLFTFSAYLGAVMGPDRLAALALVAIFLPSFLLAWAPCRFGTRSGGPGAIRPARDQRGRRRAAARRALRPASPARSSAARCRPRSRRVRAPRPLETAALAGRGALRAHRRTHSSAVLSSPSSETR